MGKETITLRHRSAGGQVSVSLLRALAEWATTHGAQRIQLTTRQEIDAPGGAPSSLPRLWARFPGDAFEIVHPHTEPNIQTTAPVAGRTPGRAWLVESIFRDMLEALSFRPAFAVNIVDPTQPYLPWGLEGLSFLALETEDRWAVHFCQSGCTAALGATRTGKVPAIIAALQQAWPRMLQGTDPAALHTLVAGLIESCEETPRLEAPRRFRPVPDAVTLPAPAGGWDASFVEALCVWAGRVEDTTFRITPWRCLVLQGLREGERDSLAEVCMAHRVTMTPGPWEQWLWVGQDAATAAAPLTATLDAYCGVNPGYGIAVVAEDEAAPPLHACMRYRRKSRLWGKGRYRYRVDGGNIPWMDVDAAAAALLAQLQHKAAPAPTADTPPKPEKVAAPAPERHHCAECGSAYEAAYGDPLGNIAPGTPFTALPNTWQCPTCGAAATAYAPSQSAPHGAGAGTVPE